MTVNFKFYIWQNFPEKITGAINHSYLWQITNRSSLHAKEIKTEGSSRIQKLKNFKIGKNRSKLEIF